MIDPVTTDWLSSPLGQSRLLARPGDGRLHLLNQSAALLWARYHHPHPRPAAALADWLTAAYGVPASSAQAQVAACLADWRAAGLLDPPSPDAGPWTTSWVIPPPAPVPLAATEQALALAGLTLGLRIDDPALAARAAPLFASLRQPAARQRTHALHLAGTPDAWQLRCNGRPAAHGATADAALVSVLGQAIELACQAEDRLLVVHGAGLAMPDGRGLLLVAPGGSGKTTLAAALNAGGLGLLSDDVVPVRRDGRLLALNTPLCLKAGSWPVLAAWRPELATARTLLRYGQAVRYLPPWGAAIQAPLPLGLLLFPRYRPGQPAATEPLTPEAALHALVAAEAVIRGLDQAKLDALARWISAVPAYALTYPDLASGLAAVQTLVEQAGAPAPDRLP